MTTVQRRIPGSKIWALSGEAARNTPAGRDRVVDLLRGGSLAIVVLGHTLMAVVVWQEGGASVLNLLAELPDLQALTWVLQVMPLFFAAGAIANRASYQTAQRRQVTWHEWMWLRTKRLMRPAVYYLAVWVPLSVVLSHSFGQPAEAVTRLSTQLLWFLGVYVIVVAATPWESSIASRPVKMVLLATAVLATDLARFHLNESFGMLNFVLVWVFVATLGLVVRDHIHRRGLLALCAALAVVLNLVAVTVGPYPRSMVGMPGEKISNMAPPTVALTLHAVALVCLVGVFWGQLARVCARPRIWHGICALGAVAMSLYLWHITAIILVTLAEHTLGLDRGHVSADWFWLSTLGHLAVTLVCVAGLVILVAPLEFLPIPWLERSPVRAKLKPAVSTAVGVVVLALGLLAIAATGMSGFPFHRTVHYAGVPLTPGTALLAIAAGLLLLRRGGFGAKTGT
jgi:hypothetical protein